MTLRVFETEANDGLEIKILQDNIVKANASIRNFKHIDVPTAEATEKYKSFAKANPNQIDLYYLEAILVSTVWNKNDDVFLPEPTWAARNTPEDKMFNFMHNEKDIIGHITGSYVETFDGKRVANDIPEEEIPDSFNIITPAVLYASWSDPELQERMDTIIASIESGEDKWKVSMECLFPHFDYAIRNESTGEFKVIQRNESSASLSKHLRVYGGTGEYQDWKVGRALRGLTFSGKGLVDQPANERSDIRKEKPEALTLASDIVVPVSYYGGNTYSGTQTIAHSDSYSGGTTTPNTAFTDNYSEIFTYSEGNTELENQEKKMTEDLQKKIAQLEADLATSEKSTDEMKKKMEKKKEEESKAQLDKFEKTISEKDSEITDLNSKLETVQAELSTAKEDVEKIEAEKAEAEKAIAALETEKKVAARKAELITAGAAEDEAENILNEWAEASDSQFSKVVDLVTKAAKVEEEGSSASEEDDEEDDSSQALENIQKDDKSQGALNSDNNDDNSNTLHKGLANYFAKSRK
jgi:hypothetical protein